MNNPETLEEYEPETLEEIEERYRKTSEILLERIAMREEMKSLLKIAKPSKIAAIREVIPRLDESIEAAERILENIEQIRLTRIKLDNQCEELNVMMERMKPEFLAFVAENHPDRLEEMEIIFSDEDFSKTH